jgi:hypothetical protein
MQAIRACRVTYALDESGFEQCRQEIEDAYQKCLAPIEEKARQAEIEYAKCVANCESEFRRCRLPEHEPEFKPPPEPPENHEIPEFPTDPPPGPVGEPRVSE